MAAEKKVKKGGNIFAAVGAATGLGNAFRFPALCLEYGGAFIIAYAVCLIFICFPLLCAELHFGGAKQGAKGAKFWRAVMRLAAVNSALIALYYGVIAAKMGGACLSFAVFSRPGEGEDGALFVLAFAAVAAAVFCVLRGGARSLSRSGKLSVILSLALFSCLAAAGIFCGRRALSFKFAPLSGGAVWADALGQSLLALSLAAGVMPDFARAQGVTKVKSTAARIIAANFCGCILALLSTIPFVSEFPAGGGVTCALTVYPQVVSAVAGEGGFARVLGTVLYAVLAVVAIHSLCSLAKPLVAAVNFRRASAAFVALMVACAPLFLADGMQALSACDRMACSVCSVLIAFAECVYFLFSKGLTGAVKLFIRTVCPITCGALALFSLCSARFNCFAPFSSACAYVWLAAVVAAGVIPLLPIKKNYYNILQFISK